VTNPTDQQVVLAVDYGTPRIIGSSQWTEMEYNIYMYDTNGNTIFGPESISTQYGYGQKVVSLPKGQFNFKVINWGDN